MMMMSSSPPSLFSDYLATDGLLPKVDPLSPIELVDDPSELSFDDDTTNANSNANRSSSNGKRPMNAFLLWARGERKRFSSDGYGVSQTSLSKLLGETWRHMSIEEKQPYLEMAEKLKRQHHLDHPDYRFKPKQQRSTTANKSIVKKAPTPMSQQATASAMLASNSTASSSSSSSSSAATPLPIQSSVLTMCHAIMSTNSFSSSSSTAANDLGWFSKLMEQPQPVILVPCPLSQPSPPLSRRAVRIQIINKRDEIPLSVPTAPDLPMTPSPQSTHYSLSNVEEATPTIGDYLSQDNQIYDISDHQQGLPSVMDTSMGYETFHDTSTQHFTDLDQFGDTSGWIDTPLSNFGTNSTDLMPSPYTSYDFLSL